MKKIIFSLLLGFMSLAVIGQVYNLNISGYVTDEDSGEPLVQQMVDISIPGDSLAREFFYFNTVFTDADGFYEDNIEVPDGETGTVYVETYGCDGSGVSESDDFSENSNELEFDFEVCSDPSGGGDCMAMFTYIQGDDPLTLVFTDYSSGNPDSWSWDFGDGETSSEQNPVHEFMEEGEYFVSLEISSDSNDCTSVFEMPVWVGNDSIWPDDCMAMYFYYQDSADFYTINFIDMSMGNMGGTPSSWSWDFDDGGTSSEQNPVHTFTDEGEYEVCLTITSVDSISGDSCESTFCSQVEVINWDYNCEAWFYYYPEPDSNPAGGDGLAMQFIDDSWGNPTAWEWEFGDGATSTEQNPVHTYAAEGEYEVCLSITSDSCESSYCEEIYVWNDTIGDCFAWFDYNVDSLSVDFSGYLDGGDSSANYTWDFGDGETAVGQQVEHVYAETGIYMVGLLAEAADGSCSSEFYDMVWVGNDFSFPVYGNVYLEDSLMADFADVYLLTFDTLGDNLVNVATTQIDANGYYEFDGVGLENCIYFVQSELTDASAYYGDYVPTYHLSALNWEEAWPVFPFWMGQSYDIYMIADSNAVNSGNGNIIGVVNADESRGLISDVEIMLMDENMSPITYLRTDENGGFQFPDLQYGTYIVYTEIVGIKTIPVTLTLTQENPVVNITIVVANGEAVLGIDKHSSIIEELGNISPNPVTDDASLTISLKKESSIKIEVLNQFGQIMSTTDYHLNQGKNKLDLKTSKLKQGVYLVSVTPTDGIKSVRRFIKIR
jgi:PKD repeat protein